MYDIALSFFSASIICSLHDIIDEDLDVGDGSIGCQLEWSDSLLIDGNVSFGGAVRIWSGNIFPGIRQNVWAVGTVFVVRVVAS